MTELLKKYIEEYEIEKVTVIGRNIVNRHPNDRESITLYLDFLLGLANDLPVLVERHEYLEQAKLIILFIEENAELDSEYLEWLISYSNRVHEVEQSINNAEIEKQARYLNGVDLANSKALVKIHDLCEELKVVDTQTRFDGILKEFIDIDRSIEKDYFSPDDQQQYDDLSKACSEAITAKMQELDHIKDVDYNQEAVNAFAATFDEFSSHELEYKTNTSRLIDMMKDRFFLYDAERLFPEAVIYQQFVYSRIFEKLSDSGKLDITQASIHASK